MSRCSNGKYNTQHNVNRQAMVGANRAPRGTHMCKIIQNIRIVLTHIKSHDITYEHNMKTYIKAMQIDINQDYSYYVFK